jgi:serine/threonine-protein kinase RsbW
MMATGSDQIELRLPRRPEFVKMARTTALAVAADMDFNLDEIDDIKTAVGEACANAVEHVCADGCPEFRVIFFVSESDLVIEVRDSGQGFSIPEVEIELNLENISDPGGLGIFIIRQLMDDVQIECCPETGTCVRMKKQRRQQL